MESELDMVIAMNNAEANQRDINLNRRFAELVGLCWHEPASNLSRFCQKCGKAIPKEAVTGNIIRPDFISRPTLVLKEMVKRKGWIDFLDIVGVGGSTEINSMIDVIYILDETEGLLAKAAIEFL